MASALLVSLVSTVSLAQSQCYDLSKSQPSELEGRLTYIVFPGSPNFEDVKKGDFPEPTYILQLRQPICIQGDEFAEPNRQFSAVHLVPSDAVSQAMKALVGSDVMVSLSDRMGANTGHHHAPLVAWVSSISKLTEDVTLEYGTAATVIRAFYEALSDGNGDAAAEFVVPEHRKGPFSGPAMTAFYRHLSEPLKLIEITPRERDQFAVVYHYRSKNGVCDGRAIVSVVSRAGSNFISSIKAINGC